MKNGRLRNLIDINRCIFKYSIKCISGFSVIIVSYRYSLISCQSVDFHEQYSDQNEKQYDANGCTPTGDVKIQLDIMAYILILDKKNL